ncbi:hypothetical protein L914_17906 [Phytophthora nicotianae]|uniref:Uncharacterized protein n=1 Tax=Phytophthora nicotianae TaxID=4792 RepID=W2MHI3_PHYNI|nr:hypothetical protein L914_17906 [Phytophthora nicotianae]
MVVELARLRQRKQNLEASVTCLLLKNRDKWGAVTDAVQGMQRKVFSVVQQTRLEKDQHDNLAVMSQVRAKLQLVAALQAALSDGNLPDQMSKFLVSASPPRRATGESQQLQTSSSMFDLLEIIFDLRVQDLHTALDQIQQSSTTIDAVDVQGYSGKSGAMDSMEYKSSQLLPFDDVTASSAIWSILGLRSMSATGGLRLKDNLMTRAWSRRASCCVWMRIQICLLNAIPF